MKISKEVVQQPKPLTSEQMKSAQGGTGTGSTETTYVGTEDLYGF